MENLKKELMSNDYYKNKNEKFFEALMDEADINKNGMISYQEFKIMMQKK